MSNPGRYRNNKPHTDTTGRRGQWENKENFQSKKTTGSFGRNKRMMQRHSEGSDSNIG
jgi:hypothetical protein